MRLGPGDAPPIECARCFFCGEQTPAWCWQCFSTGTNDRTGLFYFLDHDVRNSQDGRHYIALTTAVSDALFRTKVFQVGSKEDPFVRGVRTAAQLEVGSAISSLKPGKLSLYTTSPEQARDFYKGLIGLIRDRSPDEWPIYAEKTGASLKPPPSARAGLTLNYVLIGVIGALVLVSAIILLAAAFTSRFHLPIRVPDPLIFVAIVGLGIVFALFVVAAVQDAKVKRKSYWDDDLPKG
jgi:hypothetical protein